MASPTAPSTSPSTPSPTSAYAGLVYGKGPFFYREARASLGGTAFFSGLQSYVRGHRFRVAGPRAVVDALLGSWMGADTVQQLGGLLQNVLGGLGGVGITAQNNINLICILRATLYHRSVTASPFRVARIRWIGGPGEGLRSS